MNDDEIVEWLKGMYIDWLNTLQHNANAEGKILEAELIGQAFQELADYYKILKDPPDVDDDFTKRFFE